MGFRFRKTIKLLPGVRLNLSKSGISTSIGVPGATVNISDKGTRGTVGLPGTGISYSEQLSGKGAGEADKGSDSGTWLLWLIAALAVGMVLYGLATLH